MPHHLPDVRQPLEDWEEGGGARVREFVEGLEEAKRTHFVRSLSKMARDYVARQKGKGKVGE